MCKYTKAMLQEPKWQGCGVGEYLLRETMSLAASKGYKGIIILGEPDYYPRMGFKTCDNFNITTADGRNFDAFMGIELVEGGMKKIRGSSMNPKFLKISPRKKWRNIIKSSLICRN